MECRHIPMDKKLFQSLLLLITYAVVLAAVTVGGSLWQLAGMVVQRAAGRRAVYSAQAWPVAAHCGPARGSRTCYGRSAATKLIFTHIPGTNPI